MLLAVDLPEAQPGWPLDLEVVRRTRTLERVPLLRSFLADPDAYLRRPASDPS